MARRGKRRQGRDISGVLLLDKPQGMTSNAALQRVLRLYRARKGGHTGALDPLATGMLPLCLGEATKLSSHLLSADKHYEVTARLGIATDTGDADGKLIAEQPVPPFDEAALEAVLEKFRGEIMQVPPMYSALKRDGRPLYELAREGKTVAREARPVTISRLEIIAIEPAGFTLEVSCSKGTYIRTLVEDIADALGSCGHVVQLRRRHVDPYADRPMHTLDELEALAEQGFEALDALLIPVDQALPHWSAVSLNETDAARIAHGQALEWSGKSRPCRIYGPGERFLGLGEIRDGLLQPKRLMAGIADGD